MPQTNAGVSEDLFNEAVIPQCPACFKIFTTSKGLNSHLSMAKSCKWYRKGKNRELAGLTTDEASSSTTTIEESGPSDAFPPQDPFTLDFEDWNPESWPPPFSDEGDRDIDIHPSLDINRDDFILLPQAGPGPATSLNRSSRRENAGIVLDDDDDTRHTVEHPTAGRVFPQQDGEGDVSMNDGTTPDNPYAPFSSEMDWKIAHWAIKDAPGHKAFDRFLEIPGVSLWIQLPAVHPLITSSRLWRD